MLALEDDLERREGKRATQEQRCIGSIAAECRQIQYSRGDCSKVLASFRHPSQTTTTSAPAASRAPVPSLALAPVLFGARLRHSYWRGSSQHHIQLLRQSQRLSRSQVLIERSTCEMTRALHVAGMVLGYTEVVGRRKDRCPNLRPRRRRPILADYCRPA